jgi:predicted MarR family transcription regulator
VGIHMGDGQEVEILEMEYSLLVVYDYYVQSDVPAIAYVAYFTTQPTVTYPCNI